MHDLVADMWIFGFGELPCYVLNRVGHLSSRARVRYERGLVIAELAC